MIETQEDINKAARRATIAVLFHVVLVAAPLIPDITPEVRAGIGILLYVAGWCAALVYVRSVKPPFLRVYPVKPIGKEKVVMLHGEIEVNRYPDSPKGRFLVDLINATVGTRRAAAALGTPAVNINKLKRGALTCDWEHAERLIVNACVSDYRSRPLKPLPSLEDIGFSEEEAEAMSEEDLKKMS